MTTPKTFSVSTEEARNAPTVPFTLEGFYATGTHGPEDATTWTESFDVSPVMDARLAQWYAEAYTYIEGKQVLNPPAVIEFLALCCTSESQHRFRSLISDPDRLVEAGLLGAVFVWVAEEVIARPTPPPSA